MLCYAMRYNTYTIRYDTIPIFKTKYLILFHLTSSFTIYQSIYPCIYPILSNLNQSNPILSCPVLSYLCVNSIFEDIHHFSVFRCSVSSFLTPLVYGDPKWATILSGNITFVQYRPKFPWKKSCTVTQCVLGNMDLECFIKPRSLLASLWTATGGGIAGYFLTISTTKSTKLKAPSFDLTKVVKATILNDADNFSRTKVLNRLNPACSIKDTIILPQNGQLPPK